MGNVKDSECHIWKPFSALITAPLTHIANQGSRIVEGMVAKVPSISYRVAAQDVTMQMEVQGLEQL